MVGKVSLSRTNQLQIWKLCSFPIKICIWHNIKRVIDRKRPTCRNNNRLHTQPFESPLRLTLYDVFESVPDLFSLDFLLYLAKPSATIDHSAPIEKWHLELNLWSLTFELQAWERSLTGGRTLPNTIYHHLTLNFDLRPWPSIPT